MEDRFEKKLKELLPYIIIIGVIFLLLPLLMGKQENAITYIIQLGAFPLTALGCGFHYAFRKGKKEIILCAVAPLFYAISALLYGMWRSSWITVLIYLVAYSICTYIGMLLPDLIKPRSKRKAPKAQTPEHKPKRPRRVNISEDEPTSSELTAEDPSSDVSLDTSTTDEDIEAMLKAIHDRKN